MTDRNKVIKAFEFCLMQPNKEEIENDVCSHDDCPYYREYNGRKCISATVLDALALLKAQEPNVLTLEEACGRDYCFYEYRATGYIEPASVVLSGMLLNDTLPLVEVYRLGREGAAYVAVKDYGHEWRCWDRMPDDGQKEGERWE